MPKERSLHSSSSRHIKAYPYLHSSKNAYQYKSREPSGSIEDVKQWEDVRCPICMEHPHNAVMLLCSSHEKGCQPYICNTSYRHSNCLDQFCKSTTSSPSTLLLQEIHLSSTMSLPKDETSLTGHSRPCGSPLESNIVCPLCRGQIYGWSVNEPARQFLNSKRRSCSSESCDFEGIYSEVRKHARSKHPSVRPTAVDQTRQLAWTRFEQERDAADILSTLRMEFEGDLHEHMSSSVLVSSMSFLLVRIRMLLRFIAVLPLEVNFDSERSDSVSTQNNNLSAERQIQSQTRLHGARGSEQLHGRLGEYPRQA